jgi:hypothetical protein
MATVQQPAPSAHARADLVTIVLAVAGVTQLATGLLALFAPGAFYDLVAGYPPENHHFLMDLGSWQVALGAIALYGARRPEWRVALLGFLAVQYALHAVPHGLHVGDSDPSWQGPFALATQAFGAVVLAALFLRERAR